MDPEIEAARTRALAAGFTVATVTGQDGLIVYQLSDGQGNYLSSHTVENGLWKRAFKRGQLPPAA